MKHLYWALPAALLLPACVTINIYFPAAAAEKAADRIIDDVWQLQDKKVAPTAPASEIPAVQPAP
ncbi:hypothetical protein [Methylovorus sp. MP688]|uniref:hypothetical protein n=1 Tax=Methylovorus sp. (strain MP688) TaxID=887061 RepID=UPI0001EC45F3|nr:hypothetical protein [Methylovorus sp. MP688]ADQ84147.1 conserved hypothetical protein [Methylovorus sp. MP688]